MIDDFTPIVHRFPNKDIKITPICDMHVGSQQFMEPEWALFRERVLSEPKHYITIGGDLADTALKSSVSNAYEATMRPREQKRWLVEQLKPLAGAGKILCGTHGNHEGRSKKDADDDLLGDVFCKLDIEDVYRENACFMFLRFGNNRTDGARNPSYSIAVMHGAGGGVLTGASINKNERFAYAIDGLDVLIVGHSHKAAVTTPQKLVIDPSHNSVSFKPFKVISATSWLKYGGYALCKQMLPASHCAQEILLSGSEKKIRVIT